MQQFLKWFINARPWHCWTQWIKAYCIVTSFSLGWTSNSTFFWLQMSKYLKNLLALVPKFGGKMQPFIDSLEHDISCNIFANRCILFVFTFYTTTRLNQNWGLNFLNSKFFPLKLFHNPHRVLCRNWRTCHFRIRHAKMWENINIMMTMIIFLFDIKCTLPTETLQRFTVTVWDNQTEQRPDVPGSGMPAARPITGYTWKVGFTHKYSTPQMY